MVPLEDYKLVTKTHTSRKDIDGAFVQTQQIVHVARKHSDIRQKDKVENTGKNFYVYNKYIYY